MQTFRTRGDGIDALRRVEGPIPSPAPGVVDGTFPMAAFPDALRYLESGTHVGKVGVVSER